MFYSRKVHWGKYFWWRHLGVTPLQKLELFSCVKVLMKIEEQCFSQYCFFKCATEPGSNPEVRKSCVSQATVRVELTNSPFSDRYLDYTSMAATDNVRTTWHSRDLFPSTLGSDSDTKMQFSPNNGDFTFVSSTEAEGKLMLTAAKQAGWTQVCLRVSFRPSCCISTI